MHSDFPPPCYSPVQHAVIQAGLLETSAILQLPTGSGKTFLSKQAIAAAVAAGRRAVYLCPLRALARELAEQWRADPALAARGVGVFTGEMTEADDDTPASPRDVAVSIFTAEKFDGYLRNWRANLDWLAMVDTLVIDELHLLGEGRRGATLEGVIERFRLINPFAHRLALSATLGNLAELGEWLDARTFSSTERMVPLTWRIETFKANANAMRGKAELATAEAIATRDEGGQIIVFCQSRPRTETLAAVMREAGLRAACHHAGRPRREREQNEARFRRGELDVLVATPTLACGVNLPARAVLIHDLQRFEGGDWKDLEVSHVWQLAGRAGRPGLDEKGDVVLLSPQHNQRSARRFLRGQFEPIRSQLTHAPLLAEQVLALFGTGLAHTRSQATRLLEKSLYARQHGALFAARLGDALDAMLAAGMLETTETDGLRATRLGYVAVRHQLSPATVLAWRAAAVTLGERMSFLDALLLVAASDDFNARVRATDDDIALISAGLDAEPMQLKAHPLSQWPALLGQMRGREVVSAAKTAILVRAWTRLGDLDEAAQIVPCDPYELDEARNESVRLLAALRAIVGLVAETSVPDPDLPPLLERLQAISAMVATGLSEQNATLSLIEGIGPRLARRLIAHGVEDIEDLALADASELGTLKGISHHRAACWIEAAEQLMQSGGAYRYREVRTSSQQLLPASRSATQIDYFRWCRAADLQVTPDASGRWLITGGSQPHWVAADGASCDCADAARGAFCKHRIAVGHTLGDPLVPRFDAQYVEGEAISTLHDLWRRAQPGHSR